MRKNVNQVLTSMDIADRKNADQPLFRKSASKNSEKNVRPSPRLTNICKQKKKLQDEMNSF